jgi:hypothetical protein
VLHDPFVSNVGMLLAVQDASSQLRLVELPRERFAEPRKKCDAL